MMVIGYCQLGPDGRKPGILFTKLLGYLLYKKGMMGYSSGIQPYICSITAHFNHRISLVSILRGWGQSAPINRKYHKLQSTAIFKSYYHALSSDFWWRAVINVPYEM